MTTEPAIFISYESLKILGYSKIINPLRAVTKVCTTCGKKGRKSHGHVPLRGVLVDWFRILGRPSDRFRQSFVIVAPGLSFVFDIFTKNPLEMFILKLRRGLYQHYTSANVIRRILNM